ncbi:hypothetical protein [Micromonospora maritima]|uniref:hypothetical protein n=1 Tax=Micromonospora maritima TaxID=986711 RepID=UPI00157D13F3|nr:hypothetical protein [Micromonospora maritima]
MTEIVGQMSVIAWSIAAVTDRLMPAEQCKKPANASPCPGRKRFLTIASHRCFVRGPGAANGRTPLTARLIASRQSILSCSATAGRSGVRENESRRQ